MIISNSKKYIFVHIPKCGGTTISDYLSEHLLPQDVTLALSPHQGWAKYLELIQNRYGLNKHSTAREIADKIGPENFATYYPFAFSRNPFSRAFSAFTFTKKGDAKYRPNSQRYQDIKDMNFEEFLLSKYMQERKIGQARLQKSWVEGAPVDVAIYQLEAVDEALRGILRRFHNHELPPAPLKKANDSNSGVEWKSMSTEAEAIIADLYAEDFEFLGYDKAIPRD